MGKNNTYYAVVRGGHFLSGFKNKEHSLMATVDYDKNFKNAITVPVEGVNDFTLTQLNKLAKIFEGKVVKVVMDIKVLDLETKELINLEDAEDTEWDNELNFNRLLNALFLGKDNK